MKSRFLFLLALVGLQAPAEAQSFSLGTAQNFAVLSGSTVTNTGPTVISGNAALPGDVGVSPGTAITGFPPGTLTTGTIHSGDAVAAQAQTDLTTSYNALAGMAPTQNLTGQDLGGLTLTPGVYFFSSSAQLTGTLTLNAEGNSDALFVFQIGSTLTTASSSSVDVINDPAGDHGCNLFWQVGSSATLGTDTDFEGSILADTSITVNTGTTILDGRTLAQNGAVTLDSNTISITACPFVTGPPGTFGTAVSDVPEPGAVALLVGTGLPLSGLLLRRRFRRLGPGN